MISQFGKKIVQKLKFPKEKKHFKVTTENIKRLCLLLDLAQTYDYSQCESFGALLFGQYEEDEKGFSESIDRETIWQKFQDEVEDKFGCSTNDSNSTLATIDDNPGTGRIIDKHFYQPIGRCIERFLLDVDLRYFHPPEKSAHQIKQFLEGSTVVTFGNLIPIDKICSHRFQDRYDDEFSFYEDCLLLFKEIQRKENVCKALQRLMRQASSKKRSSRVEAQKHLWSLFRYEYMVFILNAIMDIESLVWDGYNTFQHCSPLDPDFQAHFCFRWEMELCATEPIVDVQTSGVMQSTRYLPHLFEDILVNFTRENRGFSSLPVNHVLDQYAAQLFIYYDIEEPVGWTKEIAEDLYQASIALSGFLNKFPYASNAVQQYMFNQYDMNTSYAVFPPPLWRKNRIKSDIEALELMVHFLINFVLVLPLDTLDTPQILRELQYYIRLLNDADQRMMSELEARASEEYLRKVNETLVQHRPITFAMLKDMVTDGLHCKVYWEKYCPPKQNPDLTDRVPVSSTWNYKLYASRHAFPTSSLVLFYYYIPFSESFREQDFDAIYAYITKGCTRWRFARANWFQIQEWLGELKDNSMALRGDRPGTKLYQVMEWWRSQVSHYTRRPKDKKAVPPTRSAQPLRTNNVELATLPSPCQCSICKRSLHINVNIANDTPQTRIESEPAKSSSSFRRQTRYYPERSSPKIEDSEPQFAVQSATVNDSATPLKNGLGILKRVLEEELPQTQIESKHAESSSPFQGQSRNPEQSPPRIEDNVPHSQWPFADQSATVINPATPLRGRLGLLKRKLEEEEPGPQAVPHPLQYRNNTDEYARPGSLVPLRKKQKIHHTSTLRIEEHPFPSQMEDILLQHSSPATESSPLQGQPRILKRKLEEAEPRPEIAPLPRRYRNNTDEDVEPATLGPVRKRQRTSLNLESDASGAGSIITETDEKSTESDTGSEDAMSVDEDFLTANSKLSHLTIGN